MRATASSSSLCTCEVLTRVGTEPSSVNSDERCEINQSISARGLGTAAAAAMSAGATPARASFSLASAKGLAGALRAAGANMVNGSKLPAEEDEEDEDAVVGAAAAALLLLLLLRLRILLSFKLRLPRLSPDTASLPLAMSLPFCSSSPFSA